MTNIPNELLEQIPNWDFGTLYDHFELLEPDRKTKKKVDDGLKMKFPVEVILNEYYIEYPDTGKVKVLPVSEYGKGDLIEFKREIRERKKIMLKFIYDNYDKDVTERRISEEEEYER